MLISLKFLSVFVKLEEIEVQGSNINIILSVKKVKTTLKFFQPIITFENDIYRCEIQKAFISQIMHIFLRRMILPIMDSDIPK